MMVEINFPVAFSKEIVRFNTFSWIPYFSITCTFSNTKYCSSTISKYYIKYFEDSRHMLDMIPTSMPLVLDKLACKRYSQERKRENYKINAKG